jgi:hypothetical protein
MLTEPNPSPTPTKRLDAFKVQDSGGYEIRQGDGEVLSEVEQRHPGTGLASFVPCRQEEEAACKKGASSVAEGIMMAAESIRA